MGRRLEGVFPLGGWEEIPRSSPHAGTWPPRPEKRPFRASGSKTWPFAIPCRSDSLSQWQVQLFGITYLRALITVVILQEGSFLEKWQEAAGLRADSQDLPTWVRAPGGLEGDAPKGAFPLREAAPGPCL